MPQTPVIPPDYVDAVLSPALALLPACMDSVPARVLITAIGLQESSLQFRRQKGGGPARGLYGFEAGGGVHGVLKHDASRDLAVSIAAARVHTTSVDGVWRALERDDVLATALARLLLWTDPQPLPRLRDAEGAWCTYQEIWRPGRPRFVRWPANYAAALACIAGGIVSDPDAEARAGRRWADADRLAQLAEQVHQIDRSLRDISAHLMQHLEQERAAEGRVSDLVGRCAGIEGELRGAREQFGTLSTRVDRLAASVESCVASLNLARGGWGAVVIIATALVTIGGAIAWIWDHIRS